MKKKDNQVFVTLEAQITDDKVEIVSSNVKLKFSYNDFKLPFIPDGIIKQSRKEDNRFSISFVLPNEAKKFVMEADFEEVKILNTYRQLDGQNKILIRRVIKSLDSSFWGSSFFNNSTAKITHYTLEESDLLSSFRTLNLCDKIDLLNAMHIKITNYAINSSDVKLSGDELKLIENFRQLNFYERELIKNNIKVMLPAKAKSKQKKKSE